MILRNFREEYSKALQELPEFHMDADKVRDEGYHHRMAAARRRKMFISAASVACLFLLCSVGTAVAMNYQSGRIEVARNGFSFLGEGAKEISTDEAAFTGHMDGGDHDAAEACEEGEDAFFMVEEQELVERTYDSIEEFYENESIVIAIPEIEWLGDKAELEEERVVVMDFMPVSVRISFGEKIFMMSQADNRETPTYASSTVFMGDAANERNFTTQQGITFKVFDSVEGDKVISTHAAISVNGRDIIYNFWGYKNDEVDAVLKQLDVSIYFREE